MRPRNLNSSTYSTTSRLIRNWGSNKRPGTVEKCMAMDLEVVKVKPLRLVHWRTLFMQLCIFSFMMWKSLCLYICRSSTNNEEWNLGSGWIWLTIWFILIVKRVTESTDPWGTPSSWGYKSERWLFICTLKVLLLKNSLMYCWSRPLRPKSWRSLAIPYFHVISYAFWRSKKMLIRCSLCAKVRLIQVSSLTRWSVVALSAALHTACQRSGRTCRSSRRDGC